MYLFPHVIGFGDSVEEVSSRLFFFYLLYVAMLTLTVEKINQGTVKGGKCKSGAKMTEEEVALAELQGYLQKHVLE
ncbi:hypothetical protein Hdeb2414_s0003g00085001 [Helianthus debilis subsp. tardiflorus]